MDLRAGLRGLRDLRYLKWIGVGLPVVFLLGQEIVRLLILDPLLGTAAANAFSALMAMVGAALFGLVLFIQIEAAQREILYQNRDLGTVNAVSVAIQGELDVDEVMHAALAAISRVTGAAEAVIHVPAADSSRDTDRRVAIQTEDRPATDGLSAPERTVEIPLAIGSASLGHLRLTVPANEGSRLPSPDALRTVGNQLAAAIQIGQLVGDLQRRKHEGHTLYQTLLQISNQAPLSEIIGTIVLGARDRLGADEGRMCLTESILDDFQGQQDLASAIAAGVACQCTGTTDSGSIGRQHQCAIGTTGAWAHTLQSTIWSPGELFGDLWIARRAGHPFTERDRGYLMTLAGLAAIAITAARLREHERQSATLAERDRIARELHDSLAQVLGSTHLRLRALLARADVADQPRTVAELTDLADVCEEAYRDVREAILGLREASRPRGLLEGLAAYLDKYTHQSGIRALLESDVEGELALPTDSEIQVIRVIQEALTNVRKHARASTARIRISGGHPGDGLTIVIEDDGRGFDPSAVTIHRDGGFGLQTMRERIELAGGTLRVDSAPGRGTRVIASDPAGGRRADAHGTRNLVRMTP